METRRKALFGLYKKFINREKNPKKPLEWNGKKITYIDAFLELYNEEKGANAVFTWFQQSDIPLSDGKNDFTRKEYLKLYCCDLTWAKNAGYCKSNFASEGWPTCVDNANATKNSDGTLTYTSNSGFGKVTLSKDNTWKNDSGKNGTWACSNSGLIVITEKKTTSPSPAPSPNPRPRRTTVPGPSTGTYTNVNLTGQDIINGETVEKGMKGDIVTKIQEHLNRHGASPVLVTDGKYGDKTKKAVRDFQKSKGLPASGVVEDKTWLELIKDKSSTTTPPKPVKDPLEDIYGTGRSEIPTDLFDY
jgi:hypothetical protein